MIRTFLIFSFFWGCLCSVSAAEFIFVYTDSPGFGFNDARAVAPIPGERGNEGTTLGQQRRIVLEAAAARWARHLQSTVPIRLEANFEALPCSAGSGVLAQASGTIIDSGFAGQPVANTSYPSALANSLAGVDLAPGENDVFITINSELDDGQCLDPYYYGLDRMPAGNRTDLFSVLLHEIAHGLGFASYLNEDTGAFFNGAPNIYERFIFDVTTQKRWVDMTQTERMTSAVNDGNVVWNGLYTRAAASRYLEKTPALIFPNTPALGAVTFIQAAWSVPLPAAGLVGEIVLVNDGSTLNEDTGENTGSVSDGCQQPFVNASQLAGRIALIDRGICNFTDKAIRAQAAGAIGVIIVNNVEGGFGIGGMSPFATIPTVGITRAEGNRIKAQLPNLRVEITTTGEIGRGGFPLIFTPSPTQGGSSVSHFDPSAVPNLLMEPADSEIDETLDLTLPLFRDIGWGVQEVPIPYRTYALWAADSFAAGAARRGMNDDADADGRTNFNEYAFGTPPLMPQGGDSLRAGVNGPGNLVVLNYERDNSAVDLRYVLESSAALRLWNPLEVSRFTESITPVPLMQRSAVRLNVQRPASATQFYRVRAEKLPDP